MTFVSTMFPPGSDLMPRIRTGLRAELARIERLECAQLELSIAQPEYMRCPIKVWDCGDASDSFNEANIEDIAVEILQTANNLVESFVEQSWRFEIRSR